AVSDCRQIFLLCTEERLPVPSNGFPLGGSCRRRRLMRGSLPASTTPAQSRFRLPTNLSALHRGKASGSLQRLPPGGKLSPQATDEGKSPGTHNPRPNPFQQAKAAGPENPPVHAGRSPAQREPSA